MIYGVFLLYMYEITFKLDKHQGNGHFCIFCGYALGKALHIYHQPQ